MKIVIAGSRTISQYGFVEASIEFLGIKDKITEVVWGCEPNGVDALGKRWADEHNIPAIPFKPDWYPNGIYTSSAGPIRNSQMADYADALLLIWDGTSKGSKDMRKKAVLKNLTIYEVIVNVV